MTPDSDILADTAIRRRPWLSALYPAIWRWHFWAGLIVAPILIVVSLTGAIYVFQEELTVWMAPKLHRVDFAPGNVARLYGEIVEAARRHLGDGEWELDSYHQRADPRRAHTLTFEREVGPPENHTHEHRSVYIDPHTLKVLGVRGEERSFFGTVLGLHRTLLAGRTGRFLVEAATCWGIVSLLTGLLLWWPRGKEKLWGVWLPRLRRGGKLALRDLHTIPGLYLFAFAFVVMFTGLLYTTIWGQGAYAGLYFGGQLPPAYVRPPKSTPLPEGGTPAGIDHIMATARQHFPFEEFRLQAPHDPGNAWMIYGPTQSGELVDGAVYLDASTGKTLAEINYAKLKPGAKTALLYYSIHTGSIFGLPTKILAVLTCLVIVAMSVTGVWMWWRRRPRGKFGAPRKAAGETIPKTAVIAIVVLAVFFPLVGLSLVAMWLVEFLGRLFRRSRTASAAGA